jgi:hypothetical protein
VVFRLRSSRKGVLLEDAADDDHRVGPHDVDNDLPAKLGEIVDSYDRIFIARVAFYLREYRIL